MFFVFFSDIRLSKKPHGSHVFNCSKRYSIHFSKFSEIKNLMFKFLEVLAPRQTPVRYTLFQALHATQAIRGEGEASPIRKDLAAASYRCSTVAERRTHRYDAAEGEE
jgi:hypothetical protein